MVIERPVSAFRNSKRKSQYYWLALLVLTIGIFLRFFLLTTQSLWIDEGYSIYFSTGATVGEVFNRLIQSSLSDRFHILYYLFLYYWRNTFGSSELALRLPSTLFGIGSLIVIYITALRFFNKKHALISLVLTSFSAFCVFYSQEARDYSMLIFLSGIQLFFVLNAINHSFGFRGKWAASIFFGIFTALSIFANISNLCLTAALFISHIWVIRKPKECLTWWIPTMILSTIPLSIYFGSPTATSLSSIGVSRFGFPIIYNISYTIFGLLSGITFGPSQAELRDLNKASILFQYAPQLLIAAVMIGLVFLMLYLVSRKVFRSNAQASDYAKFLILSLCFSLAFGILLAIVTKMNWLPRHAFYTWPIFALLFPIHLNLTQEIYQRKIINLNRLLLASLLLFVFVNTSALYNYYFVYKYHKDDFKTAAEYTLKNLDSSTVSVLIGGAGDDLLIRYYGDHLTLDGHKVGWQSQQEKIDFGQGIQALTKNSKKVILVANREYILGPPGWIERNMNDLYELEKHVEFQYFDIYHFVLEP